MRFNVNPNRMQLLRLKRRHSIAKRGHKLLKDKQDQLMRNFLNLLSSLRGTREKVEHEFLELSRGFFLSVGHYPKAELQGAFAHSMAKVSLRILTERIMNLRVPGYELVIEGEPVGYSYYSFSGNVDKTLFEMKEMLHRLVKLAELEKRLYLLATEIERTRRRVNALEYILIPSIEETIKYIKSRLDEAERSNITRLMRVKEILEGKKELQGKEKPLEFQQE